VSIRAGELRHRITIEQNSPTQNNFGEEVPSWSEFATRWAAVRATGGRETFADDQKFAEATHEFELRHISGVDPKMRIKWEERVFDIESVLDLDGRKRRTVIIAVEDTD